MALSTGAAMLGGAALGLLGSKGNKQGSTTTTNEPWSGQKPYLSDIYSAAGKAFHSPFGGQILSPDATSVMGQTIRGDYLNPSSNPFLQNYVNDALGLVGSKFTGMYGGQAGSNLGNSGFQEMLARTMANTALPIYANAYSQERQNQLSAAQLSQEMDRLNMTLPFAPVQAYANAVQGNVGGSTTTPYFTNPIAGAMGGALSAGALYKMLS